MGDRFKEFNDPKVYRNLKLGFAAMIVMSVLLALIAYSEPVRDSIGLGQNAPVEREVDPQKQKPARTQERHSPATQPSGLGAGTGKPEEASSGPVRGQDSPQQVDPSPSPSPDTDPSPAPSPPSPDPLPPPAPTFGPIVITPSPEPEQSEPNGLLPTTVEVAEGTVQEVGSAVNGLTSDVGDVLGGGE